MSILKKDEYARKIRNNMFPIILTFLLLCLILFGLSFSALNKYKQDQEKQRRDHEIMDQADMYMWRGKYVSALNLLDSRFPSLTRTEVYFKRRVCYYHLKKWKLAVKNLKEVAKVKSWLYSDLKKKSEILLHKIKHKT